MSADNQMQCYEFVVHFPGGVNELRLPALGQAMMMGTLQALLMEPGGRMLGDFVPACGTPECIRSAAEAITAAYPEHFTPLPPHSDEPDWFDALAGWEAAIRMAQALGGPRAATLVPPAVLSIMHEETKNLMILLLSAQSHDIPFYLSLEVCKQPPTAVLEWWRSDLAETAEIMRTCLEQHEKTRQP